MYQIFLRFPLGTPVSSLRNSVFLLFLMELVTDCNINPSASHLRLELSENKLLPFLRTVCGIIGPYAG